MPSTGTSQSVVGRTRGGQSEYDELAFINSTEELGVARIVSADSETRGGTFEFIRLNSRT